MWLFSKEGFFSVVRHSHKPGHLLVRARRREDIDRLSRLLSTETGRELTPLVSPDADYLYRLEVPRLDFARVMVRLVEELDYPNFKSAVHGDPTRDRAYGRVWSIMAETQEDEMFPHLGTPPE
jgi:hypothetical protein